MTAWISTVVKYFFVIIILCRIARSCWSSLNREICRVMRHLKTTSSSFWQTGLTTTTRLHVLSTQRRFVDVTFRPLIWRSLSRQVPRLTKSRFWKPIGPFCWAGAYFLLDSFLLFRDPYLELIHVQLFFSRRNPSVYFLFSHLCWISWQWKVIFSWLNISLFGKSSQGLKSFRFLSGAQSKARVIALSSTSHVRMTQWEYVTLLSNFDDKIRGLSLFYETRYRCRLLHILNSTVFMYVSRNYLPWQSNCVLFVFFFQVVFWPHD